jgi:hypothetical protein
MDTQLRCPGAGRKKPCAAGAGQFPTTDFSGQKLADHFQMLIGL